MMHSPTLTPTLGTDDRAVTSMRPTNGIIQQRIASLTEVPLTTAEKLLLISAVTMFVVYNCGILTADVLPIKPRDGTLGLVGITGVLLFLCRKYFCLPMMLLLIIPFWRLADAAFLHRYNIQEMGDHYASVIKMMGPVLITAVTLFTYNTRVGRQFAIYSSAALIIVCTGSDLYEWLGYAKWTTVPGRMSGFLAHPNTAPTYSLLCLTILYTLNPRFWVNIGLTLLVAIPTSLSISRSCMMMYVGTVLVYLVCNFRAHHKGLIILACAIPPLLMAWMAAVEANASHGRIRRDEFTEGRFDAIYNLDVNGLKSAERGKDLEDGWEAVWRSPMWGYGPGATTGEVWQPHNQVVAIWLDIGILGLVLYAVQLLVPLGLCFANGFRGGYCLLPVFMDIPCQQWLVDMPCYWFALGVCYAELMPHRIALNFRGDE